ncbi:MAG: lipid-A-disaccharide synthase [Rickettsiales bacterium]
MSTTPHIYIIAGEASGDQLGAWLMQSILAKQPSVRITGIGGHAMEVAGLRSLFSISEIALMGFVEILPHIFNLKRRIRQTIEDIEQKKPDIVITIDSPGFCFRVVESLKKRGIHTPRFIHYVAPTVWAYKPERAKHIAPFFNHLMVLYPFEPPYFEKEGLPTTFVGHPYAWYWKMKGDAAAFKQRHHINENATVLAMFAGSRKNELKRHLPIYKEAIAQLAAQIPNLVITTLVRPEHKAWVKSAVKDWAAPVIFAENEEKKALFAASHAALAKSGTISLECTLAGLPYITAYRAHPISIWYIRRKVKIPYVNMSNIILGRFVIPELIQEDLTAKNIVREIAPLLHDSAARDAQLQALKDISQTLGAEDSESPSDKAADIVLSALP